MVWHGPLGSQDHLLMYVDLISPSCGQTESDSKEVIIWLPSYVNDVTLTSYTFLLKKI